MFGQPTAGNGFVLALPAAFLIAACFGWVLERVLIRYLYKRPLDTLLATWGVALVLEQAAKNIFGAPNVTVATPAWLTARSRSRGCVAVVRPAVHPGVEHRRAGRRVHLSVSDRAGRLVRAVTQNRAMADCLGVRTDRVDALNFALGTGLAGLAGAALCLLGPVGPFIGSDYIVQAFMVVVLGGVGQLIGTVGAAAGIGGLSSVLNLQFSVSDRPGAGVRRGDRLSAVPPLGIREDEESLGGGSARAVR